MKMPPPTKRPKYKTKFNKEWIKMFAPVVSECSMSVPDRKYKFRCNVCRLDLSCAAGGEGDIKKHIGTPTHEAKAKASKSKFYFFVFLQFIF